VLQWLAARQRKHANSLPSYAEMGCWSAISRLKVSNAVVSAQELTVRPPLESEKGLQSKDVGAAAISDPSAVASDTSTSTGATAKAGNATLDDAWTAQEPQRKELAAAVLASRQALAEALLVWNAVHLSPNHPGRIPPLLAAALVAWTAARDASNSSGSSSKDSRPSIKDAQDDAATTTEKAHGSDLDEEKGDDKACALKEEALSHVREALRVHQVAYGGGVELFQLRYPSSELNELLECTMGSC